MEQTYIQCKNISKSYDGHDVLHDVNLDLKGNRIIGLCGPNGAGKTTLIKIIMGLLRDFHGEVIYQGQPFNSDVFKDISYLPDRTYFDKNTKGADAIRLFAKMYDDFDIDKMFSLLKQFNVSPHLTFKKMSKGMQEKFQLALVLARDTKIYILDEPIGGVDPASREKIINTILSTYQQGALLIISTHLISEIEEILNEVIFLREGSVILHQDVNELKSKQNMSVDAYFREVFR